MALKLRTKINFPATVIATGGLKVDKLNGVWTIEPDFSQLAALTGAAVTDPSLKQVWLYDPTLGQYNVLTLAGLGNALYTATSTTSLAIGAGSQTFTTQKGKDFPVGAWLLASSAANSANYMSGQVTSYSDTSLVVNVTNIGGSGTHGDWSIIASGAPGATGPTGATAISGTPTAGNMAKFTNSTTIQAATAGTDYLKGGTASDLNGAGYYQSTTYDNGTKTTGTFTFDPTLAGIQKVTNGGAHTFAPPAGKYGSWLIEYINNASAGALTTSGWTKVDGDAFDTTNAHVFRCMISVTDQGSYLSVKRMV